MRAALLIFIWWRTPDRDRRSLIDALTLTAGLALLSWIYLILPYVHNPQLSWLQKSVAIAYPLGDVLVLAMLARLLAPGSWRTRTVQFLTLGVRRGAGLGRRLRPDPAARDVPQRHRRRPRLGRRSTAAWGAAALHPAMTELTKPVTRQPARGLAGQADRAHARLADRPGRAVHRVGPVPAAGLSVIAVFSAILYLLVLSRLWDVAASHGRALRRERAVRQAGASLVSAITVEQAAAAVRSATDTLLGQRPRGDVLLAVRTDGAFRAVAAASADPAPMRRLADLAESWLPLVTGSAPILAPVTSLPAQAAALVLRLRLDAAVPAHAQRPAVGRSAHRGARGIRRAAHPGRPGRHAGDPRAPGGPRHRADHAPPGGHPPGQRGLLPHPGPGHLGRHLDRGRRREGQVRDPVGRRPSSATSPWRARTCGTWSPTGERDDVGRDPQPRVGHRRLQLPLRGPADHPPRRHGRPGPDPGRPAICAPTRPWPAWCSPCGT